MADRQVTIKLSAQDQFSGTLDKYKQKMGEAASATKNVNDSSGQLEQGFKRMQAAFDLGIASSMVNKVKDFAEEFNALGTEVNANRNVFNQLSSEMGDADSILQDLRESTRGAANDMTLMSGANGLMRMGLVSSSEQLTELMGLVSGLKSPTEDMNAALGNFGMILANQSYLRLDSLGLSSSVVRERVQELTAAGMDMQEAFTTATIDEMRNQFERLGPAIESNVTPLQRLQTKLDNLFQTGASNFATGINATVNLAEAWVTHNVDEQSLTERAMQRFRDERGGNGYYNNDELQVMRETIRLEDERYQTNLNLANLLRDNANSVREQFEQQLAANEAAAASEQRRSQYLGEMRGHYQQLYSTFEGAGGTSSLSMTGDWSRDLEFIDPSKTQNTLNQIMAIRTALDSAQSANEQGLLSDQDLAQMESMALAAEDFASAIEAGVDRFEHMTLPQALGESAGNELLGGISDQVMAALQERGNLDAEALQSAADAYDLASGRINEATLTMRDTIVPILADLTEQNTALGVERAAQVEGFLRRGAEMGLGPQAMSWGATLSTGALPVGDNVFDFQSILLDPFADAFDQIRSDVAGMGEETDLGAMTFSEMPTGITKSVEEAGVLQEVLNQMIENKYTIRVHIDDSELTAFEGRVAALGGASVGGGVTPGAGPAVERVVRDNGGQVPGSDNRGRGNVGFRPMN